MCYWLFSVLNIEIANFVKKITFVILSPKMEFSIEVF